MPYIQLVEADEAQGPLKEDYDSAVERAGKVFNILKAMSLRPGVLRASMDLYQEIMSGSRGSHVRSASYSRRSRLPSKAVTTERRPTPTTSVQRAPQPSSPNTSSMTTDRPTSRRANVRSATSP